MFGNLTTEGLEKQEDRLGGNFSPLDTDIYRGVVKLFYAGKSSSSEAQSVTLVVTLDGGREYKTTIWVTNGKGQNFFLDPQDQKKKVPLPGFSLANNVAILTADKQLPELEWEEKAVKLWDSEQKKEVPTAVMNAPEVCGQRIAIAIEKRLVNKQIKNENPDPAKNGKDKYISVPGEDREVNELVRAFHEETMLTVTEAMNGKTAGEFHEAWLTQNKGKVFDRREIKDGVAPAGGVRAGAPKAAPSAAPAAASPTRLFGKKG